MGKKQKKKKNQRKIKAKSEKLLSIPRWHETGLGEWTSENILDQLKQYGLDTDVKAFKQLAEDCSEPYRIAERWAEDLESASVRKKEFFHLSALELWKRLLPEVDAMGLVVEDLSAHIDRRTDLYDSPMTGEDVRDLMHHLDRLHALFETDAQKEGWEGKDPIDEIFEWYNFDMGYFLVCLPTDLERDGFVDEAVVVARKFAFVDRGNMLGDLGQILAASGQCDAALSQVEENLRDLPDDPWVIIKAGDVYDICGQSGQALDLYNKALKMADAQYTREGVYERLVPLYEKMGRSEEAEAVQQEWKKDQEESIGDLEFNSHHETPISFPSKKIGRNEPCPCGSGLKYKKCCLNK